MLYPKLKTKLFLTYLTLSLISLGLNSYTYAAEAIDLTSATQTQNSQLSKTKNTINLAYNDEPLSAYPQYINKKLYANLSQKIQCPFNKQYQVAIIQSGHYRDFNLIFNSILQQLDKRNLLQPLIRYEESQVFDVKHEAPSKKVTKSTYPIILDLNHFAYDEPNALKALQIYTKGSCLEFNQDNFFDLQWRSYKALTIKEQVKQKIKAQQIDMIFAFGTEAGLFFADSKLNVPVFVIDASTPEKAGIINKGAYSNKPNVYVQKDLTRYVSEIVMFHNLFKFKTLGILLDQNKVNRTAQAYEEIVKVSQQLNFELVPCYGDIFGNNPKHAQEDFSSCILKLSKKNIDAMFLSVGYRPEYSIYEDLKPLIEQDIPIYSQHGEEDLKEGALMCLSDSDKNYTANALVNAIEQYLNGKPLDQIDQIINVPLTLAINLKIAHAIEWIPSFEFLLATDKVYRSIEQHPTKKEIKEQEVINSKEVQTNPRFER